MLGFIFAALSVCACGHDWDEYDPRLGLEGSSGGGAVAQGGATGASASSAQQASSGAGSGGCGANTTAGTGASCTGGGGGGGGSGDGGAGASGTIFADEFDVDSAAWIPGGTGDWVVAGGERSQTDATAALAFDYVPSMANRSDYRIRSRMRQIAGDFGGAMEIDFRISATEPAQQYFCNWEPNSGDFLIMISTTAFAANVIETVSIDLTTLPSYDPFAPFTMNVDVVGSEIHCWLEEIPEADLTVNDGSYLTGAFGLKNYAMATAYDFIHVTAVP